MTTYFYGVDRNDLYQAGVVGLINALKKYKKNGKTKFSTYAYDYIYGEMYLLASNKNIKISKDILNLYKKVEQARYLIAQQINKIPSNLELSEYLGISIENIEMACNSANAIMSFDNNIDDDRNLYDKVSIEPVDIDTKILIKDGMAILNKEEKDIIKSRYFEDLTQCEVAKKLNMTQVMVSRYEKKSINKMRKYLTM